MSLINLFTYECCYLFDQDIVNPFFSFFYTYFNSSFFSTHSIFKSLQYSVFLTPPLSACQNKFLKIFIFSFPGRHNPCFVLFESFFLINHIYICFLFIPQGIRLQVFFSYFLHFFLLEKLRRKTCPGRQEGSIYDLTITCRMKYKTICSFLFFCSKYYQS